MYRCDICHRIVPPGTKSQRIPIEFRVRHYPARLKANRFRRENKVRTSDDPGGTGHEIVRELTVCPECAVTDIPPTRHTG